MRRLAAGDEVYGADPMRRAELETRRIGYVLAISCEPRSPQRPGLLRTDETS